MSAVWTQRPDFKSGANTVGEEHLDMRCAVDVDRFAVVCGHTASVPTTTDAPTLTTT